MLAVPLSPSLVLRLGRGGKARQAGSVAVSNLAGLVQFTGGPSGNFSFGLFSLTSTYITIGLITGMNVKYIYSTVYYIVGVCSCQFQI